MFDATAVDESYGRISVTAIREDSNGNPMTLGKR